MRKLFLFWCFAFLMEGLEAQSLPAFASYFKSSSVGEVKTKTSKNFRVQWVHPRDDLIVDTLIDHMEKARASLTSEFKDAFKASKKVPIEIYPELQSFSEVSGLSLSRFRATGTIALTLEQRLMILSPRNLTSGFAWAETAVHEYIHYLIREISPENIPIWLHEGVAQLYQEYPYNEKAKLRPSQWGLFSRRRANENLLDLKTLREPFPFRETPEEAELAYVQAQLFSKWLDEACGVLHLIKKIGETESVEKGLEFCVGLPIKQLEKRFIPDVMASIEVPQDEKVEYYARDFSEADPLEKEGEKADKGAQNFVLLSTQLYQQGRWLPASIEMQKALEKTPVSPPSWRRHLAKSLLRSENDEKAIQVLVELVDDYPQDAAAWYLLGRRWLEAKNFKKAWTAFLRAFFVNPFLDGLQQQMEKIQQIDPSFKDRFFFPDLEQ